MGLDRARARVLATVAGDRTGAPHGPGGHDAVLVRGARLGAALGLLHLTLARLAVALRVVHDEARAVGLLVVVVAALCPQGPRAPLAVPTHNIGVVLITAQLHAAGTGDLQGLVAGATAVLRLLLEGSGAHALAATARLAASRPVAPHGGHAVQRCFGPDHAGARHVQVSVAALAGEGWLLQDRARLVLLVGWGGADAPPAPLRELAVLALAVRVARLRAVQRALARLAALVVVRQDRARPLADALTGGLAPLRPFAQLAVLRHARLGAGRVALALAQVHELALAVLLRGGDGHGILRHLVCQRH
mmetsp:Transcript_77967/g.200735  ORF Transcript_77967/g.200735 Transcript_77967/m.200735 type:complete len:305 (+) Transcript_77967:1459-2373(+)